MRVLFCGGSPKSGSWAMRGLQIAQAGKWCSHSDPRDIDIADSDVIVVVKKAESQLIDRIHAAGKPLVYDILDFWPQTGSEQPKDLADCMMLAKRQIGKIRPHAIIAANKCMANDLSGCAEVVRHIYHHYRLEARPVRGGNTIYYDGYVGHLGRWGVAIERAAKAVGYKFAIGVPKDDAAALFSARDNALSIRWKSNVKAANAHGYGVPLISRPENSVIETHPYAIYYNTEKDLHEAVMKIADCPVDATLRHEYSLERCVESYREFFQCL